MHHIFHPLASPIISLEAENALNIDIVNSPQLFSTSRFETYWEVEIEVE